MGRMFYGCPAQCILITRPTFRYGPCIGMQSFHSHRVIAFISVVVTVSNPSSMPAYSPTLQTIGVQFKGQNVTRL